MTPLKSSLDIIIPVFGSPNSLRPLVSSICESLSSDEFNFKIILVNDSCPFGSGVIVDSLSTQHHFIQGVHLIRNFGQHAAIAAGLTLSSADWVVVMDCDLQDNPKYITSFFEEAFAKKVDVVLAHRTERKVSFLKRMQSQLFHFFMTNFIGFKTKSTVGNFGLYSKRVIHSINSLGDKSRPFPYLVQWLGYPASKVEVMQDKRFEGHSSYSLSKLVQLSLDIAIGFSDRPLKIAVFTGFIISLISTVFACYFMMRYFTLAIAPSGWTSLIVTVFLSTGAMMFTLGIVGLYVGKCFEQTKNRPVFVIDKIIN